MAERLEEEEEEDAVAIYYLRLVRHNYGYFEKARQSSITCIFLLPL